MAKKRTYSEMSTLEDIKSPVSNTTIHGAVTAISPVKKGRKSIFFEGALTDSTATIRLVGFNVIQQKKLLDFHERKIPAQLVNCELKLSRYSQGMEAMLKSSSEIKASHRKEIDAPAIIAESEPSAPVVSEIVLGQVQDLDLFAKVIVPAVKVVEVKEFQELGDKIKQDVIVGDHSGTAKVTFWEEHVGCMQQGRSYTLKEFVVRTFQSTKYLSRGANSELLQIADIGPVHSSLGPSNTDGVAEEMVLKGVVIVGVASLETYKTCFKCRSRVEPMEMPLGSCSRFECQMVQRYDLCQDLSTAKLVVMHSSNPESQKKITQVHVHGEKTLREIAAVDDTPVQHITRDILLCVPPIATMTVAKDTKIIQSISRRP